MRGVGDRPIQPTYLAAAARGAQDLEFSTSLCSREVSRRNSGIVISGDSMFAINGVTSTPNPKP